MNGMKRILSWLLIVCMAVGMFPALSLTAEAASYTKATSISVGDSVVFVCDAVSMEMTGISTTSTKYGLGTEISSAPAGTMAFTVEEGSAAGTYAFKNSEGSYLYWTSGNSLNVDDELSEKTSWSVSFDASGNAAVVNASTMSDEKPRQIWWNVSSPRFACYTGKEDGDGYKAIQIYSTAGGGNEGGDTPDTPENPTVPKIDGAYMLVTSASDLIAGETYVIAAKDSDVALSKTQNTNNRGQADVVKEENALYFDTEVQEFVLGTGLKASSYSLKLSSGGYIYAASASSNHLKTEGVLSDNSSWRITISDDGTASIIAQGENTHNDLKYNSGSKIFSCYAEGNSQKSVALYRKVYSLVTDLSQLQIGDSIIIAAKDADYAAAKTPSSNNRAAKEVVKSPTATGYALTFTTPAQVAQFILREGTVAGTYSFYDSSFGGYIYAASSSDNYLRLQTSASANSSWKITIAEDGTATVTAQGASTHNTLKYNATSNLFSAYLPSSNMADVAIYRKPASKTTYTATFYVNDKIDQTIMTEGSLALPDEATFEGWNFVGWTIAETSDLIAGTTTAPAIVSGDISISGDMVYYAVFELSGTYTTRPTVQTTTKIEASMKIITGEGTAYFSMDNGANRLGQAATEKGVEVRNNVEGVDTLMIIIKPADGYRIACVEKSSDRLFAGTDYSYDATLGAYTYTFEVNKESSAKNYFRISFLPRISDGGYTATQITSWDGEGAYVITGLTAPENYNDNKHEVKSTYLLYGDHDTALDDNCEAVGRKSSALQLYSIGVSLNDKEPYTMTGLGDNHMMYFEAVSRNGETVYAIRFHCSSTADHPHYIAARTSGAYIYTTESIENNDYALWRVSYLDNGAVKIQNVARPDRYLMFNSNERNLQFRVYAETSTTADYPILYKSSKEKYKVSYSQVGSGTVKVTNITYTPAIPVANGSLQNKDNDISFAVSPAMGYQIASVTVNGKAVALTDGVYVYTGLDQDIDVVVTFTELPPATFTVQYYLNNTLNKTVTASAKTLYIIDTTVQLTYNGKSYPATEFSFDSAINGTETYSQLEDQIPVTDGDVIKVYFSTTKVERTKEVTEITISDAEHPEFGGTGDEHYTDENEQDIHTNVMQAFHIDLNVKSNDMIEEVIEGGNTDVILVLDHSNSMYPPYSDNVDYIKAAVKNFANIVLANGNEGNNRIAMVQYDSEARAWTGSDLVAFKWGWDSVQGVSVWDRDPASYGLQETKCFMTTTTQVNTALNACMYEPDTQYTSGGATNTMGGFFMTDLVARTRSTSTTRDLVIIMFTDGLPSCRYLTNTRYFTFDNDGTRTSAWELRRALEEAQNLHDNLENLYKKSEHTIINVALLNDSDINSQDMKIIRALMSDEQNYQWTYDTNYNSDNYVNLRDYVGNMSKYFTKQASYADQYTEITGSITSSELSKLYEDIAYKYVAAKYVTGVLTDVIPADFELTEQSKQELIAQGCTITYNSDGTTTITKNVTADQEGDGFSYDLVFQGPGCGSVYTNEYAKFDYVNLEDGKTNTTYMPKPTVPVIPFTVDDRQFAQLNMQTMIDITANDLFGELTEGGYEVLDYQITLTDENGNPMTYNDAIEQTGYCFDAVLDPSSNTVIYYTETGGVGTFYYVVSAKVKDANGNVTEVASRATRVDVLVTALDKYAEEVTKQELPEGVSVVTDEFGNVQQLYLVTLSVNLFDIKNGTITDKIPEDFEFLMFKETGGLSCSIDKATNTITVSGINITTDGVEISYYIRHVGTGYGVHPTNIQASITYTPDGSTTSKTEEFPVPTAGLNPFTVNDVDIAKAGETNTLNIQDNDLYASIPYTMDGYTVSMATTYLTDDQGNRLTDKQIAELGIEVKINSDGSITYTAPDSEGAVQFYYVVEAIVTEVDGTSYADNNSMTLVSRPTLVTVYTIKDIHIIVDFGLDTMRLDCIDYSGVEIDKDVLLSSILTTGSFNTTAYGELIFTDGTKEVAFRPTTTVFDKTAEYSCRLTLAQSDYTTKAKTLDLSFDIIPANNIYFEEYFIDFDSAWTDSDVANSNTMQSASEYHNQQIQGYDTVYVKQEDFSNGNQKEVTVCAHDIEHNGYFTFAGTGFDIIGSTNANSGVLVAEIYEYDASAADGCGTKIKNILVDTWMPNNSYEQLPVIQFRTETYGVYRVKLRAFYNAIFDHNYQQAMALSFNASTKLFDVVAERSLNNVAAYSDLEIIRLSQGTVIAAQVTENGEEVYYAMANSFDGTCAKLDPVAGTVEGGSLSDYLVTVAEDGEYVTVSNGTLYMSYDGVSVYADSDAYLWKQQTGTKGSARLYAAETLPCVPNYRKSMSQIRELLGLGKNEILEITEMSSAVAATKATRALVDADNGHYNVYVDAIRIYNPIGNMTDAEKAAYAAAGELDPIFTNINDTLLDSDAFTWGDDMGKASGILYIGYNGENATDPGDEYAYSGVFLSSSGMLNTSTVSGKTYLINESNGRILYETYSVYVKPKEAGTNTVDSASVDYFYTDRTGKEHQLSSAQIRSLGLAYYDNRYEAIGPENEVYLKDKNGIAFAVEANVSVQISAKVPTGNGRALLQVYDAVNEGWRDVAEISSRTEMYYKISSDYAANGILILRCVIDDSLETEDVDERENTVISLCNIKTASGNAVATGKLKELSYEQIVSSLYAFESEETVHVSDWSDWALVTEATCTENGLEVRACVCGKVETREIAALGHSYVGGVCTCGATETTRFDSNLGLTMNVSVGAEMQVMYTVLNASVKSYERFYIEVVKEVANGESVKTVYSLNDGNMEEKFAPNGTLVGYGITYTGIFASEMGDNFTATLYAVAEDGTVCYGQSVTASIKAYLMEKLSDSASSAELKTLAVDMLNYGAAAQISFNYNVENLVNADLTEAQKALGTQTAPEATDSSAIAGEGANITASVSLQSKVLLYVNCNYAKTENSELEFVVKNEKGEVLERFAPSAETATICQGVYANVGARQMRELVTIELYDCGELVSQTLTWNIESYVAQVRADSASGDALIDTVNAMLAYGDSAAAYLSASGQ